MRASLHNPKYTTRISNVVTDAVIIRHDDWKRLKRASVHITAEQQAELRARQEQDRQQALSQIQTKRSTLINPTVASETTTRTHSILQRSEDRVHALQIAERKADEDLDEVKHVKSQMVAAEARTVRDGQLIERAALRQADRETERQWADDLESNRREALKLYEDREASLKDQRVRGRAVISAQIEEHKINTILEAERRDREAKALKEQNDIIAAEDQRILLDRKRRQQAFLQDCLADETARQERKTRERQLEKEEVTMVMEVAAQRALEEAALQQERDDQRALKEREIAAIRKKQQRAMDGQAVRDEVMAMKIQKEKDEEARERERAMAEKSRRLVIECKQDQDMMIAAKRQRLVEQAAIEQAEVQRVFEANKRAREKARKDYERKVQINDAYRTELGETAAREWDARQPDLAKKAKERGEITGSNDEYLARVNRLRDEKIEVLRKKGVPEKYLVDIQADRFELR
jgi:hypothetical protein